MSSEIKGLIIKTITTTTIKTIIIVIIVAIITDKDNTKEQR